MVELINLITTKLVYQIEDLLTLHVFLFVSCLCLSLWYKLRALFCFLLLDYCILTLYSWSFMTTCWSVFESPSWLLHPYSVFLIFYDCLLISFWISLVYLISYIFLFIQSVSHKYLPLWHKCQRCSIFNQAWCRLYISCLLPLSPCLWLI